MNTPDCCACSGDPPHVPAPVPAAAAADAGALPLRVRVPQMDCPVEEAEIRRALERVEGVRALRFQLAQRVVTLDADADVLPRALDAIRRAGFEAHDWPVDGGAPSGTVRDAPPGHADHRPHGHGDGAVHDHDHGHDHDHDHDHGTTTSHRRLSAALALAIVAELIDAFAGTAMVGRVVGMALAAAAIALAGFGVYRKGLAALRHGRLNINALMTVAVTGAFVIGQWPEAAMVMALYAIAEAIEARAVERARGALTRLLALAPARADVRQPDGRWLATEVAAVPLGAIVRVRTGERVPLDGRVVRGRAAVDQAPVTGESLPVDKTVGDAVFAGTLNATGLLEVEVQAPASDSTLARILHAVETAQATRAPMQRFVDRFAAVYTPVVFALALAVALLGPFVAGWTWLQAVYKALVLLVIACPCALVISTPVTLVSALAAAARRGIVVKGGVHLETAGRLKVVALDKTGTVTEGRPTLASWTPLGAASRDDVQRWAIALAAASDHPVSKAIAQGLATTATPPPAVDGFHATPGQGIEGRVGAHHVVLGHRRALAERGLVADAALEATVAAHEGAGRTVTLLAADGALAALFAVADAVKPTSREAVASLAALGVHVEMLSGDNTATAEAVAKVAGIAHARGGLLPADKQRALQALQAAHGPAAMVGDGINDAPALAQADVGIAMGHGGTDLAIEAADVVVMNDDLRRIADLVRLSRATRTVLWQNIALALGIKAVFFVLAVAGSASMWMAVFADMGASLLVVGNGLRLLRSEARGADVAPSPSHSPSHAASGAAR